MRVVFADAAYWIALWNPRDAMHERALAVVERLGSAAVVTTQVVLFEALNFMAGMGEFRRLFAVRMVRELEENPDVEIVPQTDTQFRSAVDRYAARPDQTWGLTDCASFLLMEERNIVEALTHDRDFEQAGFTALLR
ncbi:MAG: PIN domain-containing protein [Chloroflexi bacterium]|nr:PIN domain-containing protein [Chloroflexota bacterium]